jgi:hypothetical protein
MRVMAFAGVLIKNVELSMVMEFVKYYFPYAGWRKDHLALEATR